MKAGDGVVRTVGDFGDERHGSSGQEPEDDDGGRPKAGNKFWAERREIDRQRGDCAVGRLDDMQGMGSPRGVPRGARVDRDRGLGVGADGHRAEAREFGPDGLEEAADRLASLIPFPPWRHAVGGVLPQQFDEAVEIGGLPGLHVTFEQQALFGVGLRSTRGTALRISRCKRRAGPLQCAVDRSGRGAEQTRRLDGRPPQHVGEQQGGPLPGRQKLDRGDEGELHGLARLVPRFRTGLAVDEACKLRVRVRLQPGDVGCGPACGRPVGGRPSGLLKKAMRPRPGLEGIEAAVGGDRVEPTADRAASVEFRPPAPGPQKGVLDEVVRLVQRAHHPVTVELELAAVGGCETLEGQPIEDRLARPAYRLERWLERLSCGFCSSGSGLHYARLRRRVHYARLRRRVYQARLRRAQARSRSP